MIWALFSVLSGLGDAISFAAIKKLKNLNPFLTMTLLNLSVLPLIALGLLIFGLPSVPNSFYAIVLINCVIFLLAQYLIIQSLKSADLSVAVPMLSFTPVFSILTSYFLLNELPKFYGFIGIVLVVAGAYILNSFKASKSILAPFMLLIKNKSVMQMFLVSFLFSVTAVLAKKAITLSNPGYFMFMQYLVESIILVLLFHRKIKEGIGDFRKNIINFSTYAVAVSFSEILIAIAFTISIVPYAISLKRSSIIFSVLIGFLFFKEKNFKHSIIGATIMFAGALLIILS